MPHTTSISARPGLALCLGLGLIVPLFLSSTSHAQLDAPIGGWRQGNADAPYTQRVSYPAVTPGLDADTPQENQIRGRIEKHGKGKVATLVVNGTAMPVRMDETGAFARPFSFGAGSNSVEARYGKERHRVQFYQTAAGQPEARLRVLLSWDSDGTDLDLHVITPSGEHAWYGERVVRGGAIDIDVTTGYGPEIFSSAAPEKGLYQIYINYYGSGRDEEENAKRILTTARLSIIYGEGTASEKRQEFLLPMRFPGELILAKSFVI
ncbi:MAG: DUF2135 domain-containing protein [Zoogloeaceae bacterium]|jgi:uncharacterized protein YfaP (DUF2135 family)|nr:DUF2135 domain-containing protein [Zoogloeaceae bacterium]